jgi:hypothetical protein
MIAIVGSIGFQNPDLVRTYVRTLLPDTTVISGAAEGVDSIAELEARACGLSVVIFPADWKTFGRAAGPIRNRQIVDTADSVVAFWNGRSRGTLNTVIVGLIHAKPVRVVGEDGQNVALKAALSAAKQRGVIAAIHVDKDEDDVNTQIIAGILTQNPSGNTPNRPADLAGMIEHFGLQHVQATLERRNLWSCLNDQRCWDTVERIVKVPGWNPPAEAEDDPMITVTRSAQPRRVLFRAPPGMFRHVPSPTGKHGGPGGDDADDQP